MGNQIQAIEPLKPHIVKYLRVTIPKLRRKMRGVQMETIGFDDGHEHMAMVIPPKYAVTDEIGQ